MTHDAAGAPTVLEPILVLQNPDGSTLDIAVPSDEPLTLGRDASNAVVLESTFVSKRHATVGFENGQYIVRDLRSANGTRVNGAPASVTPLVPGDVLEVGDRAMTFVDRGSGRAKAAAVKARERKGGSPAAPRAAGAAGAPGAAAAPSGAAKLVRLGLVALLFGVGLFLAMRFLLITEAPPSLGDPSAAQVGGSAWLPEGATPAAPATDSPLIRQVLAQAKTAGVSPGDALFDEAVTQYDSGRLVDAARLFSATLEREPARTIAKTRLGEVRTELEAAIARHRAEAERLANQLRYDDAVTEWERVLLLLEPNDPRVSAAKSGHEAARRQAARGPKGPK